MMVTMVVAMPAAVVVAEVVAAMMVDQAEAVAGMELVVPLRITTKNVKVVEAVLALVVAQAVCAAFVQYEFVLLQH